MNVVCEYWSLGMASPLASTFCPFLLKSALIWAVTGSPSDPSTRTRNVWGPLQLLVPCRTSLGSGGAVVDVVVVSIFEIAVWVMIEVVVLRETEVVVRIAASPVSTWPSSIGRRGLLRPAAS